jgi:predicted secreted Zn-dependent protease
MYEAALYMAAGCTGAVFNVPLADDEAPPEVKSFYENFFKAAAAHKKFFDAVVDTFGTSKPEGVGYMWDKNSAACPNTVKSGWPDGFNSGINEAVGI